MSMRTPWRKAAVLVILASVPADANSWGYNNQGQLSAGVGDTTNRLNPIVWSFNNLVAGNALVQCKAGTQHSACVDDDGNIYTAGRGLEGQLATGTYVSQTVFQRILQDINNNPLGAVTSFSLGSAHSSIVQNGQFFTAGNNALMQLGVQNGAGGISARPAFGPITAPAAPAATNAKQVSAGATHTLGLTVTNQVVGWGGNLNKQLSAAAVESFLPFVIPSVTPVAAGGTATSLNANERVTAVEAGGDISAVLTNQNRVLAWGRNPSGLLGTGTITNPLATPTQVTGLPSNIIKVSCGANNCGALGSDGQLYIWGDNSFGQIGDGTTTSRTSPVQLTGTNGNAGSGFPAGVTIRSFSMGDTGAGAIIQPNGYLTTWGAQNNGYLGNGQSSGIQTTPKVISLASTPNGINMPGTIYMAQNTPTDAEVTAMGNPAGLQAAYHGLSIPLLTVPPSPSPVPSVSPRPSPAPSASPRAVLPIIPGAGCPSLQSIVASNPGWASGWTVAQWDAWWNTYGNSVCSTSFGNVVAVANPPLPLAIGANGLTQRGEIPFLSVVNIGSATRFLAQCNPPNPASSAYANFGVSAPSYASNALLYFICNFLLFDAAGNQVAGPLTLQMVSQFQLNRPTFWTAANTAGQLLTSAGGTFGQVGGQGSGNLFQLFDPIGTVLAVYYADIPSPSPLPSPSPRPSPLPSPFPSPRAPGAGSDTALLGLLGLLGLPFLCLACYCCLWALYLLSKLKKMKKCMCEQQMAMQPSSYAPMQQEVYYVDMAQPMMAGTPTYVMDGGMELCPAMPTGFAPMVLA